MNLTMSSPRRQGRRQQLGIRTEFQKSAVNAKFFNMECHSLAKSIVELGQKQPACPSVEDG